MLKWTMVMMGTIVMFADPDSIDDGEDKVNGVS